MVDEGVSIFFGPPDGNLLQSDVLKDVQIANLPPNTIMLNPEWKPLPKQGISRQGLPCVPGFVLTDYKSQSRTMDRILLGLYGSRETKARGRTMEEDRCEILSLQLSRCQRMDNIWLLRLLRPLRPKDFVDSKMPAELITGHRKLLAMSEKMVEAFGIRHKQG